jgi:hypothetical protein
MSNKWQATGILDAVLVDVLLKLDYEADDVTKMSAQQRIDALRAARDEGRLDDRTVEMLSRTGILLPAEDASAC